MVDTTFGLVDYEDIMKAVRKASMLSCSPNKFILDYIDNKLKEKITSGYRDFCNTDKNSISIVFKNECSCIVDVIKIEDYDIQRIGTNAIIGVQSIVDMAKRGKVYFDRNIAVVFTYIASIEKEIVSGWYKENCAVMIKKGDYKITKSEISKYTSSGAVYRVSILDNMRNAVNTSKCIDEHIADLGELNNVLRYYTEREDMQNKCNIIYDGIGLIINRDNELKDHIDLVLKIRNMKKEGANTIYVLG